MLALVLAGIGLYGLLSYHVTQRTREIGVRMALGASRGNVMRMVLREAGGLTALGVGLGIPGAIGAGRLIRSMLFRVDPFNPLIYVVVIAVLVAAAALAALVPAWRAANILPQEALRAE